MATVRPVYRWGPMLAFRGAVVPVDVLFHGFAITVRRQRVRVSLGIVAKVHAVMARCTKIDISFHRIANHSPRFVRYRLKTTSGLLKYPIGSTSVSGSNARVARFVYELFGEGAA